MQWRIDTHRLELLRFFWRPIFRSPSPADGKFVKAQHIYASSTEFHTIQDPVKLGSEPIAKIKHYDIEAEKIVGGQS